jgi:NAD(P)-dependent dehydrogenase (short-subunit alcohol dehydrogenase family)
MLSLLHDLSNKLLGEDTRRGAVTAAGYWMAGILAVGSIARYLRRNSSASIAERRRARGVYVVVVTGCDSGFGRMACEALVKQGYFVIATCLTKEGSNEIASKVHKVVICDVTNSEDILKLTNECQLAVNSINGRLYGLVNNAGVGIFGLIDYMSMESIRFMMEVNYFGLVAVTKALLPMLKKSSPGCRIVNISSVAGLIESSLFGPYAGAQEI